jgi:hypothetical protein
LGYFNYGPEKLLPHSVPKGKGNFFVADLKAALWAENCPNFSFFFVLAGTSPFGAGKTSVFSGKVFSGKLSQGFDLTMICLDMESHWL